MLTSSNAGNTLIMMKTGESEVIGSPQTVVIRYKFSIQPETGMVFLLNIPHHKWLWKGSKLGYKLGHLYLYLSLWGNQPC